MPTLNQYKKFTRIANDEDKFNGTTTPLGISGVFTGEWVDTIHYASIIIGVIADQASATDGLKIEWSNDGVSAIQDDVFTLPANKGKVYTFMPANRYYRIVYTNGTVAQSSFILQSILKSTGIIASSHRIQDSIVSEDDAELVKSILTGQDQVTGFFELVQTFNGALNVTDGLVHKLGLDFFVTQNVGSSKNPNAAITSQDRTFTISDTSGWIVGDWLLITEGSTVEFSLLKIISLVANTSVTVHRPIDGTYTTSASIQEKIFDMAVDGSTPQSFRITPPAGEIWQFTRVLMNMTHSAAGDDSKFGGIAALINGVLIRVSRGGVIRTASQWFANEDMKTDMFNVVYDDKAGGGNNSTSGRWTLTQMGIVAELVGDDGDYIEILIQDDLTGLISYKVKLQGRDFAA